ncbi:hypothetical protein IFR05_006356 [Cadophora sp. M221]|nr:hypothetical protein IFR05_006356 [Cadophora sp. M221]
MAEVAQHLNAVELEDIHIPNTGLLSEPTSSPDKDHVGDEEPVVPVEVSAPNEELVTVPIMKLQQLVEFCAQVLRESRAREAPASNLELGTLASVSPAVPTTPSKDGLDCVYTLQDFATLAPEVLKLGTF